MTLPKNWETTGRAVNSWLLRWASRLVYRLEVEGAEHIPARSGALLVSHHTSLMDPVLIERAIRRALGKQSASRLRFFHSAQVTRPEGLDRARKEIEKGHLVCLFAEGRIPRTGKLLRFTRAIEGVAKGLEAPIIPIAMDRRWGPLVRPLGDDYRWKIPYRFPYPVTLCFGEPLPSGASSFRVRRAVQEQQADLFEMRKAPGETLPAKFIRAAKRYPFRFLMVDHSGRSLSFLKGLVGALALRRVLERRVEDDERVGVLLPPSIPAALINAALSLLGKVVVNLNYTTAPATFEQCMNKAGIRTVITSRKFLGKLGWSERPGFVAAEDLASGIGRWARLKAFVAAAFLPAVLLKRLYSRPTDPDSPAAVLFSSGSTGEPKGVVLSHFNVLSNIQALTQVFDIGPGDRLVGVLPFFHAFGYTATLWFPLTSGQGVLYHPDPRDGKAVGQLVRSRRGTILVCPPTFFQLYLRQCEPVDFHHLNYAVAGAEKLKPSLARAFEERFGVPLLEGYGATELSPVVSINTFDGTSADGFEVGHKLGSLGHPLPGVAVKVIGIDSGEELDVGEEGLLCVKGPNVMLGYLDDPQATAEVVHDGWYVTGDVGRIDEDGFLEITDRLSRFSKLGGEMVPHQKVENEIQEEVPAARLAVTAVPDERKGERLVVLHTALPPDCPADEICRKLRARGLSNLWIPRPDSFIEVEDIPLLATGKLDLQAIRRIADEKMLVAEATRIQRAVRREESLQA